MKIRDEAQAVIIRNKGGLIEFLLLKRVYPESGIIQMRLVKGGIEAGETAEEAAKREIREEVGLEKVKVGRSLGKYEYEVDGICHKVASFLVEADPDETARAVSLDEGDAVIEKVSWVNGEEAIKLLTFPQEQNLIRLATN